MLMKYRSGLDHNVEGVVGIPHVDLDEFQVCFRMVYGISEIADLS